MKIRVGDRVNVKAGDERGGWGTVSDVPATSPDGLYHVRMYNSVSDVRVFERNELHRPKIQSLS